MNDVTDADAVVFGRQPEKMRRVIASAHTSHSAHMSSPYNKRNMSPQQKLSTALHKVGNTFSPKRPRGLQNSTHMIASEDELTPRARINSRSFNIAVNPPTPSIGSQFSKMARDLAKDIEASQRQVTEAAQPNSNRNLTHSTSKQSRNFQRNPLHDIANQQPPDRHKTRSSSPVALDIEEDPSRRNRSMRPRSNTSVLRGNEKVQLPDLTGLTSVVGTPLKSHNEWRKYALGGGDGDIEGK